MLSDRRRLLLLAGCALLAGALLEARGGDRKQPFGLDADVQYRRVQKRQMTENGGPPNNPGLRHVRVSSNRALAGAALRFGDRFRIGLLGGMANLLLHSSEGQSRAFAPEPAAGATLDARLATAARGRLSLAARARYLAFTAGRDTVVFIEENPFFRPWQKLSADWSETEAELQLALERNGLRVHTGPRIVSIAAREQGLYRGMSLAGELRQDRQLGVAAGLQANLGSSCVLKLGLNIVDETAFEAGVRWLF